VRNLCNLLYFGNYFFLLSAGILRGELKYPQGVPYFKEFGQDVHNLLVFSFY